MMKYQKLHAVRRMAKNQKDISLQNLSKYLLQGAEMLRDSCPNCNVPLLKLKGKIFCGSCNKEVIYATEESVQEIETKLTYETESKSIVRSTETVLLGKLENVTNQLPNQQGEELLTSLEIIEKIFILLEKIREYVVKKA